MSRILSSTTSNGCYTLPTIVVDVHDTREAAEAAWSKFRLLLRDRIVLFEPVYCLMTGLVCERRQRSLMAISGSWWAAPVLWVCSLPLWAVVVFMKWL